MDRQAVAERLDVAVAKCQKLGIRLSWNYSTAFNSGMFPVHEITNINEYNFSIARQGVFLIEHGLRAGNRSEECIVLALGAFHLNSTQFGRTAGRSISEGADANPCATPGRDDGCCSTIPAPRTPLTGSNVIHRDFWPAYVFRYVLIHEMGHYLGLCHFGHNGFQNIMYTADPEAHLNLFDWGMFEFYYESEPEFTLSDGMNVWRFIIDQLPCCLDDALVCGTPDTTSR